MQRTDWRLPEIRVGEWGEGHQRYTLPVLKEIRHEEVMCSMGTTVNNTVCFFFTVTVGVNLKSPYHNFFGDYVC